MKQLVTCLALVVAAHVSLSGSEALKAVVGSYLEIQAQLAADKIDGIKAPSAAIAAKADTLGKEGPAIAKAAKAVDGAKDIDAARDAFGPLSDAVMAAVQCRGVQGPQGREVAFCPMVEEVVAAEGRGYEEPVLRGRMMHVRRIQDHRSVLQRTAATSRRRRERTRHQTRRNAQCQPTRDATAGSSRMLTIVSRNPRQICSVSAVPTCVLGLNSETSAENCAESATIEKPQHTASSNKSGNGPPNVGAGKERRTCR